MSNYIDRDLLLAEIEELKKPPWYNDCGENYERIIRSDAIGTVEDLCVKSAPTADVVEVRHGKWIENFCYNICSVCEKYVHAWNDDGDLQEFAYCPHCGAKMDGDTNDEL